MDGKCSTLTYDHRDHFYANLGKYYEEKPSKKPFNKNEVESIISEIVAAKSKT